MTKPKQPSGATAVTLSDPAAEHQARATASTALVRNLDIPPWLVPDTSDAATLPAERPNPSRSPVDFLTEDGQPLDQRYVYDTHLGATHALLREGVPAPAVVFLREDPGTVYPAFPIRPSRRIRPPARSASTAAARASRRRLKARGFA